MKDHLTEEEINKYIKSDMSPEAIERADLHLIECVICRRAIDTIDPLDDKAQLLAHFLLIDDREPIAEGEIEHLDYEQIAAYVDKELNELEGDNVVRHIEACSFCDDEVQSLLKFKEEMLKESSESAKIIQPLVFKRRWFTLPNGPKHWSPLQIAASVIIIVAIALMTILLLRPRAGQPKQLVQGNNTNGGNANSATSITNNQTDAKKTNQEEPTVKDNNFNTHPQAKKNEPRPSTEITVVLKDGNRHVMIDAQGKLVGANSLPSSWQRAIRETIISKRLSKPKELDQLKVETGTLLGTSDNGIPFELLGPVGNIIENNHPTFHWGPLDGASSYTISIFDSNLNEVATSGPINALEWRVPLSLKRGKVYSWQVTAIKDGLEVTSPRIPARPPRFKILDQEKLAGLERARRTNPDSHLLLGMLYAQAGLVDKAEREFQALVKDNPHSDIAKRLLEYLRSWKSQ